MCRIAHSSPLDPALQGARLKFARPASKSQPMDLQHGLYIVGACAVIAATTGATWSACRWWYGRKLLAAAHRLHKSDQGRLFAHQQTMQARKQVEALKKELASVQQFAAREETSRPRPRELDASRLAVELAEGDRSTPMPRAAVAPGFADTQLMP